MNKVKIIKAVALTSAVVLADTLVYLITLEPRVMGIVLIPHAIILASAYYLIAKGKM